MQLVENLVVADRFRLIRMIGRGGMGSVWQAQHTGLDTPCAVKFIEGELANVAEAHARFEREAKAAAQLRSPHVVQIFDHGVWQGIPYIAMELLDGEDLGKRLAARGGRLSPGEINSVVQQVCRALTKAHGAGIVHRDLKPDNIFLVRDDDREIVKILDFGVAKKSSQAIDGSNTKTGAMLGTPYYMSPEQAQGIKSVDARSDLWSLAVIVFQALTGRLPFESEALGDLLVKIIVNPIPVPSTYTTDLPIGFDRWWAKAADRNPDNRFPTAKDFAESLQLALGQSSLTEITDRQRAQKMAGQTALLAAPATAPVPMANTPAPAVSPHTAAITPNPAGPPQQAHPLPSNASTGNGGATFSGVEPPATIPKKGIPVPLIAGFAALALIGLVGTGVAVVKRSNASTGDAPTATATDPPPPTVVSADPPPPEKTETPEPPPPPTATVAEDPPSTPDKIGAKGADPTPPPVKPIAKPVANNSHVTAPAVKPPAPAPAPATKPTASTKKFDVGF